jgi:phosphoribosylformylglycinamidine synthase
MEVCVALAGDPRIVAMQDLGAAGLTSSSAELAHRGGCGIEMDVARVSRRERGMTPYEVMLSESQERMLLVVRPRDASSVQAEFDRWDLHSDVIGTVTDTGRLVVADAGEVVCDLPLDLLIDDVPLRHPVARRPAALDEQLSADPLAMTPPWPMGETLLRLLKSPNIGSRRSIFRRYDHQVGDDTVVRPGGDAALLRVRGTGGAIALTTDGNGRYAALDPRRGAAIAVCEAARNVVAVGATPVGVTNCLNFGNPEKPEVFWELSEAVEGMREACLALGVPVVSGNVSLYNDTEGESIAPTTVIGMVGHLEALERHCAAGFARDGDTVLLVGPVGMDLGGSEYQRLAHGVNAGPRPTLDLDLEARVQAAVREMIGAGLLASCHDLAEGGLGVALAESCILGGRGAALITRLFALGAPVAQAGLLFGESQSRFLTSAAGEDVAAVRAIAERHDVEVRELGTTGGDRVMIADVLDLELAEVARVYDQALLTE